MILHVTPVEMLAGLGGLVVLVFLWRASVRSARRAGEAARAGARWMPLAGRVVLTAAVIAGAEWIVMTYATGTVLRWVVLGAPALLAGYGLTKVLTVTTTEGAYKRGRGR